MKRVRSICICAVCCALCYVLPVFFHLLGLGFAFSPMHIPVMLCGLVCGGFYGAVCGIVGPILSTALTGMPSAAQLLSMIPELLSYGAASGLLFAALPVKGTLRRIYCAMLPAILIGRVVGGMAKALIYLSSAQAYSFAAWISAYFVSTLPGTVLLLAAVPTLVLALMKARLVERCAYKECV